MANQQVDGGGRVPGEDHKWPQLPTYFTYSLTGASIAIIIAIIVWLIKLCGLAG